MPRLLTLELPQEGWAGVSTLGLWEQVKGRKKADVLDFTDESFWLIAEGILITDTYVRNPFLLPRIPRFLFQAALGSSSISFPFQLLPFTVLGVPWTVDWLHACLRAHVFFNQLSCPPSLRRAF